MAPFSVFENAGQDCCARSRLLVEESAKDELLEHYAAATRAIVVGDPESTETRRWARWSPQGQRETVEGYIATGIDEGATVLEGGGRPDDPALANGFYLRPTILDGCTNEMVVAREEIFGPVVSVITLRDRGRGDPARERHAVRPLGLALDARRRPPAPGRARAADGRRSASTRTAPSSRRRRSAATRQSGVGQGARDGRARPQHRAEERLRLDRVGASRRARSASDLSATRGRGPRGRPARPRRPTTRGSRRRGCNDCSPVALSTSAGMSSSVTPTSRSVGKARSARTRWTARTAREPSDVPSAGSPSASATRSRRSAQSARDTSSVSATTSPIVRPCGRCLTLPSACPRAWSAAQSERFMASPAVRLAHERRRRASASDPSSTACAERVGDVVAGLEAERDRERGRVRHGARPDRLRHRVDARVRGGSRWKPVREHGIHERVLRAHVRVAEADLPVALGVGEDARPGDLAPGARRGRAEDEPDARQLGCPASRLRSRARAPSWSATIRAALATSSAEPPPIPTTAPSAPSRTRAASSSASANVGSPGPLTTRSSRTPAASAAARAATTSGCPATGSSTTTSALAAPSAESVSGSSRDRHRRRRRS